MSPSQLPAVKFWKHQLYPKGGRRWLHRTHWLIARPIIRTLCLVRGHYCYCIDDCCVWDDGETERRYCHRCLRWVD